MLNYNYDIYIDPTISKKVLTFIREQKKIDYKELKLSHLKKKIENLKKLFKKELSKNIKKNYRNYLFWELIKKKYNQKNLDIKQKKKKSKKEYNINFSDFIKFLGYNPSLLSLLIYDKEINQIVKLNSFFENLQSSLDLENISSSDRILLIELMKKKEINIVTPLCPDYEHVKIASNLYKYTFKKLGSGIGLMGKRFISILNDLNKLFKIEGIKLNINLLYGDFEGFNKLNCKRLNETESSFLKKIDQSSKLLSKKIKRAKTCGSIVKELSSKKAWESKVKKNCEVVKNKMKNDLQFKTKILEIAESRSHLYSSWFPSLKKDDYLNLVVEQGAEYTTMGDLFSKNFKNMCVLAFDHSKMKIFYGLNNKIPVLYGKGRY